MTSPPSNISGSLYDAHVISNSSSQAAAFDKGWRSLPDELKVEILSYNLTCGVNLYSFWFFRRPWKTSMSHPCVRELMSLCIGAPEWSAVAREIFYGKNTFCLFIRASFRYPKPIVNHLIRTIIIADYQLPSPRSWSTLEKLSVGHYGFRNLRTIHFAIFCSFPKWDTCHRDIYRTHVEKSELIFFPVKVLRLDFGSETETPCDVSEANDIKRLIFDKLTLVSDTSGKKPKETLSTKTNEWGRLTSTRLLEL